MSEEMRTACAEVFESWIAAGTQRAQLGGLPAHRARALIITLLAALEGAFVLARATRSTEPLLIAGEALARATEEALRETAS